MIKQSEEAGNKSESKWTFEKNQDCKVEDSATGTKFLSGPGCVQGRSCSLSVATILKTRWKECDSISNSYESERNFTFM